MDEIKERNGYHVTLDFGSVTKKSKKKRIS